MPVAYSTTSIPLCMDPFASGIVFPCCSETITARSSIFFINKSLYLDKILALLIGVVFDHFKKALAELSIANSTVALLANSTSAICSPIAGLKILPNLEFFSV